MITSIDYSIYVLKTDLATLNVFVYIEASLVFYSELTKINSGVMLYRNKSFNEKKNPRKVIFE